MSKYSEFLSFDQYEGNAGFENAHLGFGVMGLKTEDLGQAMLKHVVAHVGRVAANMWGLLR